MVRSDRRGPGSVRGGMSDGSPSLNRIRKNRRDDKVPFSLEVKIHKYFMKNHNLDHIYIYEIFNFSHRKINICFNLSNSMEIKSGVWLLIYLIINLALTIG